MNPFEFAERVLVLAESLEKTAPELAEAMRHLRTAANAGLIDQKHLDTVRRGIFTDRMTGHTMGNSAAYEDFDHSAASKGGVHIRMDGNDFGTINKMHGFEQGNEAIKQFANMIRESVDESVGQKKSKLFRIGGDEFHLHVPDHDSALRFAQAVRKKSHAAVPFGGTHRLTMSLGFGPSAQHAEAALINAKQEKKSKNYSVGQADFHAHSLVPGKEGSVPLDSGVQPIKLAVR